MFDLMVNEVCESAAGYIGTRRRCVYNEISRWVTVTSIILAAVCLSLHLFPALYHLLIHSAAVVLHELIPARSTHRIHTYSCLFASQAHTPRRRLVDYRLILKFAYCIVPPSPSSPRYSPYIVVRSRGNLRM